MRSLKTFFACGLLAVAFVIPAAHAGQAGTAPPAAAKAKTSTAAPPSAQEIADAKGKGLVWVNLNTRVYHKDGSFYGTTKHGKFMTEEEATKAGYRSAKESKTKKPAGK